MAAPHPRSAGSLGVRLAWFAALWAGSVVGLGIIGFAIKLALR
ncbi:hypothetical protein C8P66_12940 [Humitalea rosea]|uniref:DUF2474 family protein n=1 Tax=Humitalea rosea TaxID=990373 RepID=A0A2W7JV96_9PROT|nr:DUF2474 domain-containing protein [Humitalea rosea]PZW39370.1 hypothetical protein C8P66_12940 [Humitalea rosea]